MKILFFQQAWTEYVDWQRDDRANLKRINQLIKEIKRSPFEGIGKPEPLKHQFAGYWSRRIDGEHRLVYAIVDDMIAITQCRGHY